MPKLKEETSEMRYLLGTLSPAETDLIDERFFQDDDAKLQELEQGLGMAETELIDAYVRKELPAADRKLFAARLQRSPALLERVRFAEALKNKIAGLVNEVEPAPEPRKSWWRQLFTQPAFAVVFAGTAIVMVAGGVLLLNAWRNVRNLSGQIANERATQAEESKKRQQQSAELQAKADRLAADLQTARNQSAEGRKVIEQLQREAGQSSGGLPTSIASIVLMPGIVRSSGSGQQLTLLPGTKIVQLRLSIDATGYSSYSVSVESADGGVVASQDRLKAHGRVLAISIPARRLPPGDYVVSVKGVRTPGMVENLGDYYQFRILQRR